ncbi:MAG: response regulator, partial [Candidatus Hydrogenedentota bacterium]
DTDHVREIVGYLRENGFRAVACCSPQEALGRIRRELPAAVLVEIVMPKVSGFDIAARMQADRRLSNIPILFISDIQKSDGNDDDYFPKPLDIHALVRALRERIAAGL